MPNATPPSPPTAVISTLSSPRVSTYLGVSGNNRDHALRLYGWNARVSAALMLPTHFAEVATRNAVSDGLTAVYGPRWPWDPTFTTSLPNPSQGYNPRRDLITTRARQPTTGKIIAELKFVFWQKMFTSRHDIRVWDPHIAVLFPGAAQSPRQVRRRVYDDLEAIRQLRNRIAHHEPIFARNLHGDLSRIMDLVRLRCSDSFDWVTALEEASAALADRP